VVTTDAVMGAACAYLPWQLFCADTGPLASSCPTDFRRRQITHQRLSQLYDAHDRAMATSSRRPRWPSLAMVEALSGQIYLVVVVARLVSIWGKERATTFRLRRRRGEDRHNGERHDT
jgi:hypothetical protein